MSALIATNLNYFIGEWLGPKIFTAKNSLFFKPKYLTITDKLYKKWGGNIILFGSFIPIIRTFGPFMAGVSSMHFLRFAIYNLIGISLWIGLLLYASYLLGNVHANCLVRHFPWQPKKNPNYFDPQSDDLFPACLG